MIPTDLIEDVYELSPVQHGMLFHDQFAPGSGVYVVQFGCTFEGSLDYTAFEQAWDSVIERHPVLRSSYHWHSLDKPLQVVNRQARMKVEVHDWRNPAGEDQRARLDDALRRDRDRGFDLAEAPLMRCALFRVGDERHEFVWSFHHLLLDGWSVSLVLTEFLTVYEHLHRGMKPPAARARPFSDYIAWLQQQDMADAAAWWKRTLAGCSTPTPLPQGNAGAPRSPAASPVPEERLALSADITARLQAIAKRHQITVNNLVQGAWALLLSRHSGEQDVVFGSTVSGRPADLPGVESVVGMMINTLPMRVRTDWNAPLVSWLKSLRQQQVELQQYEHSPLVEIHGWSDLPRNRALFESIVVFENYPIENSLQDAQLSLRVRNVRSAEKTNFPITLVAVPGPELTLKLAYDHDRFDTSDARRMLGHLQMLLGSMAAAPDDAQVRDLEMLTPSEVHQLVTEWNRTETNDGAGCCLPELFEAQVDRTPGAEAVRDADRVLTFAELDSRANRLAQYLHARNIGPGSLVGVFMRRSVDVLVAVLGTLKAGAAYVPLEPSYPAERLEFVVQDSNVRLVLTEAALAARVRGTVDCLELDSEWHAVEQMPASRPAGVLRPNDLAYMIYTSGSTGRPKGVMVPHSGFVNYLTWALREYRVGEGSGAPVQSPLAFDLTITSLFCPLLAGRCVYLLPEQDGVEALTNLLEQTGGFSLMKVTPAHLEMLSHTVSESAAARSAQAFVIGGEALWAETLAFWRKHAPHTRLINEYGPTETVVGCSIYELPAGPFEGRAIPIGRPIANTRLYVLDRQMRLAPAGAVGELYIGGAGVAYGYLNRPDLTAEKFVPDPFTGDPGARLYRSGDLARFRQDGVLEYLGRIDHQVKIRGFRIEPGEIESALLRHPAVREALVITDKDLPSEKQLVAYVVMHAGAELNVSDMRRFLEESLPPYMVPSIYVPLDNFPLTSNGKVDRAALPSPDGHRPSLERVYTPPSTPLEEVLAEIWSEVLGVDAPGVQDSFFELGGHSLLATQVVSRISDTLQVDIPLRRFFEAPAIAGLAAVIQQDPEMRARAEEALAILENVSGLSDEDVAAALDARQSAQYAEVES
jgi:amino acid adenylation domain-containing protein